MYAHHSVAQFDMDHLTSVTGAVTKFEWSNPHTYVYLDVKDDKGTTVKWVTELRSVPNLSRVGWTRDTLKPGDKITAHGHRAKDGRAFMIIARIDLANGQVLTNGPESLSQTSRGE
jgi:hypothetical protein